MRTYAGGATRDDGENKPEFAGFLSPIVLRRFATYMLKHQMQADGKKRSADNWKKGIPRRDYLESLYRHFFDVWGTVTEDDDKHLILTEKGLEEALCAMLFNVQGLLREVLLGRDSEDIKGDVHCVCPVVMDKHGFTREFLEDCKVEDHAKAAGTVFSVSEEDSCVLDPFDPSVPDTRR